MKEVIVSNTVNNIKKLNKYSDTQLKEIKYGLESLYLTCTKIIVISIICILTNLIKELILFVLSFGLIKLTAFGLHAKKSWQCWITSIPIFVIIPLLIKYLFIPPIIIYCFLPILFIIICLYAPADTEKRPLISKKKRLIYKILSIITCLIYFILILLLNNQYISSVLFYSILLECLLINPLSYKLFGLRYRNYLTYKMKGGIK